MSTLRSFEGRQVIGARMIITNAGADLSDALEVDPEEFPLGAELTIVLKCRVDKVRYEKVPKTDSLVRVHSARTELATVLDDATIVAGALDEQQIKLEEAKGKTRIEGHQEPDHEPEKKARRTTAAKRAGLAAVSDANGKEPATPADHAAAEAPTVPSDA